MLFRPIWKGGNDHDQEQAQANDTLEGGAGDDQFAFLDVAKDGHDIILSFNKDDDRIRIHKEEPGKFELDDLVRTDLRTPSGQKGVKITIDGFDWSATVWGVNAADLDADNFIF